MSDAEITYTRDGITVNFKLPPFFPSELIGREVLRALERRKLTEITTRLKLTSDPTPIGSARYEIIVEEADSAEKLSLILDVAKDVCIERYGDKVRISFGFDIYPKRKPNLFQRILRKV